MRVLDHLLKAIRDAGKFNPDFQVAPACILWPDRDRQWEAVMPVLQAELPELMILGDYAPEKRTGPAIWLKCDCPGVFMVSSGLMDDGTNYALNDAEAKKKPMLTASPPRLKPFNLIHCNLCDSSRLYAIRTPAAGVLQ